MASSKLLELDPHGDVQLVLSRPNAQKLQWSGQPSMTKTQKRREKKQSKQNSGCDTTGSLEESPDFAQLVIVAYTVETLYPESVPEFDPETTLNPEPVFELNTEPTVASRSDGTEPEPALDVYFMGISPVRYP
jgi:hypothetical protein